MQRKSMGIRAENTANRARPDLSSRCRGSPGRPGPVQFPGDVLPNGTTTGVRERRRYVHRAGIIGEQHAAEFSKAP